jgi:DNA helicase TIP49 (TBP-interacting protein)
VADVQVVMNMTSAAQSARLISITGRLGKGKTAMAMRVCQYLVRG